MAPPAQQCRAAGVLSAVSLRAVLLLWLLGPAAARPPAGRRRRCVPPIALSAPKCRPERRSLHWIDPAAAHARQLEPRAPCPGRPRDRGQLNAWTACPLASASKPRAGGAASPGSSTAARPAPTGCSVLPGTRRRLGGAGGRRYRAGARTGRCPDGCPRSAPRPPQPVRYWVRIEHDARRLRRAADHYPRPGRLRPPASGEQFL